MPHEGCTDETVTTSAVLAQVWRSPRRANLARALKTVDAHLALLAARRGEAVLTTDVDDYAKLAPHVDIEVRAWPPT